MLTKLRRLSYSWRTLALARQTNWIKLTLAQTSFAGSPGQERHALANEASSHGPAEANKVTSPLEQAGLIYLVSME